MTTTLCRRRWFLFLTLLAFGCGGGDAAVQGTVTLDGAPVESGFVSFIPADKAPAGPTGRASIVKGHYTIPSSGQLKPGLYRVEVQAPRKTGKKIAAGSPAPPGTMVDEEVEAVPEKYNKKSTLQKEVKAGSNAIDLEVTSSGK
jgi:hypothetical protein